MVGLLKDSQIVTQINLNTKQRRNTMKFCTECGKKLSDGAKFCDECGTKVGGGSEKAAKREVITMESITKLLDDEQTKKVKDAVEYFKEENDCERIHIIGEDDFEGLVANFAAVIKARGGEDDMVDALPNVAIALIDNSKTGQGKRGTLITRMGLFIIDKEIPNYEDGSDDDGGVPWSLFVKFGKPFDDENYSLLKVEEFNDSDEVDGLVKENLKYSDVEFLLRFSRTELLADQIDELASALKEAVACADESEDEDDDAEDVEEADDEDEVEEEEDDDADYVEEADDEDEVTEEEDD